MKLLLLVLILSEHTDPKWWILSSFNHFKRALEIVREGEETGDNIDSKPARMPSSGNKAQS